MSLISSLRRHRGRVVRVATVALASVGLLVAGGAAPASAAQRLPYGIGGTAVMIQTHRTGHGDVRSVGFLGADGKPRFCVSLDAATADNWAFAVIDVSPRGVNWLASYSGGGCQFKDIYANSLGNIDTRTSGKFTVYAKLPPRSTP